MGCLNQEEFEKELKKQMNLIDRMERREKIINPDDIA